MTLAWMTHSLVVGCFVVLAALALEGIVRLARWQTRWVWLAAIGVTLALGAMAPFRARTLSVASHPPGAPVAPLGAAPQIVAPVGPSGLEILRADLERVIQRPFAAAQRYTPEVPGWGIAGFWLVSSLALMGLAFLVQWRLSRARARWPLVDLYGTEVRVAPEDGPAVIGLNPPEIVVPRWLLLRTAEEQRLVLAHEREHLRAGDPFVLAAGWAAVALVPWHPALWWMAARLRLAVELDCDMRILRRGVVPRFYGSVLIDLAARCSGLGAAAAAFADRPTQLERRLLAMRPRKARFAAARAGALGILAATSLVIACAARMPGARDIAGAPRSATSRNTSPTAAPRDSLFRRVEEVRALTARDSAKAARAIVESRKVKDGAQAAPTPAGRSETRIIVLAAGSRWFGDSLATRIPEGVPLTESYRILDSAGANPKIEFVKKSEFRQGGVIVRADGPPGTPSAIPGSKGGPYHIEILMGSEADSASLEMKKRAMVRFLGDSLPPGVPAAVVDKLMFLARSQIQSDSTPLAGNRP